MRRQKPLNLKQSNVPNAFVTTNYRYKLVDNGHFFTVNTEDIILEDELPELISDYKAQPLFGRPCPLCVPSTTSYALVLSKKYALFCICCGRYFYDGVDRTDYTQWIPPKHDTLIHFVSDTTSAPVEYAMLESGLSYIPDDPIIPDEQVKLEPRSATSEPTIRITSKLDKDLNYIKLGPWVIASLVTLGTVLVLGSILLYLNNKMLWIPF
jgi:hypothetical protein